MKKVFASLIVLSVLLVGCNQSVDSDEVAKVTFDWEKATLEANYKTEQELLYEKGTYEIHKDTPVRKNNLKFDDMEVAIYYDEDNDWFYSLISYTNPEKGNKVEDIYVVRQKNEDLKIDIKKSKEVERSDIANNYELQDCVHCN